eukprot:TRINITY_DN3173_c0_g1_i1.p1 TRINITY_DN3173_c0_g1~~TRINITY_DN3173_c0_g1_i1.p1  ORF type:complete len:865 (+),score=27.29 TRINITY_DN3173_c0_g1_i1:282-2597(+)
MYATLVYWMLADATFRCDDDYYSALLGDQVLCKTVSGTELWRVSGFDFDDINQFMYVSAAWVLLLLIWMVGAHKLVTRRRALDAKFHNLKEQFFPIVRSTSLQTRLETDLIEVSMPLTANVDLVFEGMSFTAPKMTEPILQGVSGQLPAGEMMAVMGASGSGKSTLLNLLGGHAPLPKDGFVKVGDRVMLSEALRSAVAFVPQFDPMLPKMTVQETMEFQANFVCANLPRSKQLKKITQVLELVELSNKRRTYVGTDDGTVKGLSGGQRKRLSIALMLLAGRTIIVLDEPTSGLSSGDAKTLVASLGVLCAHGCSIIASIHQPRPDVFDLFDQLLLLAKGHQVYSGPRDGIGTFLARKGFECPPEKAMAEHMIDVAANHGDSLLNGFAGRPQHDLPEDPSDSSVNQDVELSVVPPPNDFQLRSSASLPGHDSSQALAPGSLDDGDSETSSISDSSVRRNSISYLTGPQLFHELVSVSPRNSAPLLVASGAFRNTKALRHNPVNLLPIAVRISTGSRRPSVQYGPVDNSLSIEERRARGPLGPLVLHYTKAVNAAYADSDSDSSGHNGHGGTKLMRSVVVPRPMHTQPDVDASSKSSKSEQHGVLPAGDDASHGPVSNGSTTAEGPSSSQESSHQPTRPAVLLQLGYLLLRLLRCQFRSGNFIVTYLVASLLVNIIVGLIFRGAMSNNLDDVRMRLGVLFYVPNFMSFWVAQIIPDTLMFLKSFWREYHMQLYSPSMFVAAQVVLNACESIIVVIITSSFVYWVGSLRYDGW